MVGACRECVERDWGDPLHRQARVHPTVPLGRATHQRERRHRVADQVKHRALPCVGKHPPGTLPIREHIRSVS